MSNGDSLDGFVFPPFIPTASTRPATPPAPPAPPQHEPPAPAPAADAAGGRMTMPWDLETPIVRDADQAPAPAADTADDADEDLPWLEVPSPRDAAAEPAAEASAAPADDEAFPEWMAWDARDETDAETEMRDTVAPVAGLEDFVPMDELGGIVAPAPAVEWAEAEPAAFDAVPPPLPEPAPARDVFDELLDSPAAAAPAADWSLDALDATEPPSAAAPEAAFDAPATSSAPSADAAAEVPSFDAFLSDEADGGVTLEPAAAEAERPTFVADAEAVIAAEPQPSAAADEQPAGAEPDPFTAASVAEAEAVAPTEAPAGTETYGRFDDVAERLESIARMLRERPDELFSGAPADPLALLVTGYVMGYTARGGR